MTFRSPSPPLDGLSMQMISNFRVPTERERRKGSHGIFSLRKKEEEGMVLESFAWEWGLCGGVFLHGGLPPSLPSPTTQRPSAMTASRQKGEEGNQGEMQQPNFFFRRHWAAVVPWCLHGRSCKSHSSKCSSSSPSPPPPPHTTQEAAFLPSFLCVKTWGARSAHTCRGIPGDICHNPGANRALRRSPEAVDRADASMGVKATR